MRRLTVEIERSDDRWADADRVVEVYATLQRFPGSDEVEILVRQGRHVTSVPLPNRCVGYCDALEAALRPLVGDALRVAILDNVA